MASIFSYDPDPPRVASPWLTPTDSPKPATPQPDRIGDALHTPPSGQLADYGVTRLEAEPQEGPTEYKLHLLLRPRRNYSSSSTGRVISGSQQHEQQQSNNQSILSDSGTVHKSSKESRQHRLEGLTTQLLWRLQQSSPYHASSTSELVLPKLPEDTSNIDIPSKPGKLLAGLEASRGALYEIGVSDDGTFVGLARDEMDESLKTLGAMAASLGCRVEVEKMVVVGDCEWYDPPDTSTPSSGTSLKRKQRRLSLRRDSDNDNTPLRHQEQLWVAEALVIPNISSRKDVALGPANAEISRESSPLAIRLEKRLAEDQDADQETKEQLRISLTGPTTSGKSSLLGTLSTATLDNGRGKSRLSLLKHRHEIASGVTSSVAQELIGYRNNEVINYASGNVTSWTDIHASTEMGRLVFVSDSAGHPRYRRTTVRGLVGWSPHWTVLCVAADDGENAPSGSGGTSSAQDILGTAGVGVDLARAHLELCLKLDRPLAIVITKLDLASKTSLRQTLSKILSAVKATGRTPSLLPPDPSKGVLEPELRTIPEIDVENVRKVTDKLRGESAEGLTSIVPIILTSAAKGTGIRSLHALLQNLPIPPRPTANDYVGPALNPEQPACLFHIEDVFGLPASLESLSSKKGKQIDSGIVVSGHLRFGRLSTGDTIVIGPFPSDSEERYSTRDNSGSRSSPSSFGASLSNPSTSELNRIASRNLVLASVTRGEWHQARIVSIRNLRLPVRKLDAGQVGTVGIVLEVLEPRPNYPFEDQPPTIPRIRKGMVIAIPSRHMIQTGHSLQAASGFTASFEDSDINSVTSGSLVVVYIASIRATARVLRLVPHSNNGLDIRQMDEPDDVFGLHEVEQEETESEPVIFGCDGITDVTLELINAREWIELGSQILIMPGGGRGMYSGYERGEKGVAGLEGFVGKVIEVVD